MDTATRHRGPREIIIVLSLDCVIEGDELDVAIEAVKCGKRSRDASRLLLV